MFPTIALILTLVFVVTLVTLDAAHFGQNRNRALVVEGVCVSLKLMSTDERTTRGFG